MDQSGNWEEKDISSEVFIWKKITCPEDTGHVFVGRVYLFWQRYHEGAPIRTHGEGEKLRQWLMRRLSTWITCHSLTSQRLTLLESLVVPWHLDGSWKGSNCLYLLAFVWSAKRWWLFCIYKIWACTWSPTVLLSYLWIKQ